MVILKIGVFLPVHYEGGSFRLAKLYAKLLKKYADSNKVDLQIVFGNTNGQYNVETDMADLKELGIEIRYLEMKKMSHEQARQYYGYLKLNVLDIPEQNEEFVVPYDRANGFQDCDFWLFMVDRIFGTVLPLKPYGIFATDFIQRYVPDIFDEKMYADQKLLTTIYRNFRNADLAFACTDGTAKDLLTYVGRSGPIVLFDPLVDDTFIKNKRSGPCTPSGDYFIWVTNGTIHKNHERALRALKSYYEKHRGKLKCVVTGVHTHFFDPKMGRDLYGQLHPYHRKINDIIGQSSSLLDNLVIKGNISDDEFQKLVSGSRFLWHNVIADNGTFSVIEAARMGIRSLSSRYPQQVYIDRKFNLGMNFFDPFNVAEAADKLIEMEKNETPYTPPEENLNRYNQVGASYSIGNQIYTSISEIVNKNEKPKFIA